MIDWVVAIFSAVVLIFYFTAIVLLCVVRLKLAGKIKTPATFFVISVLLLSAIRILDVLAFSEIFSVLYLHETLVMFFSFFLLMTALSFLKAVKKAERS